MPDQKTIWKRRATLMAVVGLLVAVPVTLAVRGGDGDEGDLAELELPTVGEPEFNRKLGIKLRLPEGWRRKRKEGAIVYRSRDRRVLIAIAAPGPARDRDEIHEAAVDVIKSEYRRVRIGERSRKQRLGGKRARLTTFAARSPKKGRGELRILVATVRGKKRAYLVEVVAGGSRPSEALVEAQLVLNNLRLRG